MERIAEKRGEGGGDQRGPRESTLEEKNGNRKPWRIFYLIQKEEVRNGGSELNSELPSSETNANCKNGGKKGIVCR